MKLRFAALLMAGASIASVAQATEAPAIQFNDLTLRYILPDDDGTDADGYGIEANFGILDNVYVTGAYNLRSFDAKNANLTLDLDMMRLGVGGMFPLTESGSVYVYGNANYERLEVSVDGSIDTTGGGDTGGDPAGDNGPTGTPLDVIFCLLIDCSASAQTKAISFSNSDSTGGYSALAGVRAEVFPNVELGASYRYIDWDEADDPEKVMGLSAAYRLGSWVIAANYNDFDELDFTEYQLGIRWDFGRE